MRNKICRVAALFVYADGVYSDMPNIDVWDATRDARKYLGPYPVVAHPPCNLWVNFAHLNYKRWGGEHNMPGNDGGCFAHALMSARKFGGVIEHPAQSRAFAAHGIGLPARNGWTVTEDGLGYICEVWQSAYGHLARKRTWLLYYSPMGVRPDEMNWERRPGTHQIGAFDQKKPVLRGRSASATPPEFRDALVRLALRSIGE